MEREHILKRIKQELAYSEIKCIPNQIIVLEGTRNGTIYHVENGWVKVSKFSDNGKENIIDICGRGEFIGLPTLFLDHVFPVNVTAIKTSKMLLFNKNSLERYLLQEPEVMATFLVELGQKVYKVREIKIAANQHHSYQQVLDLLVHFAKIFGTDTHNGRLIPFNLTQQDIAHFVGLSRPRVSMSLKGLLELGYIYRQGKYFVIDDSVLSHRSNLLIDNKKH
ncbi:MAG: Crp/Fnr family transcriptional regulator [Desulfotomaculaceae bacterium]|nr:Crp/Fnr family transcriptional regulator [Desulfotomaculaceae bacterium]